ncbi:hypothetical protein EV356DRAFT_448903 [Viridothelium virens]|uniref:DUF7905 domain-containing protein n=1 Tax=Viridothelium virens TaxID=1048519 RepID=A0A6A6H5F6_VIRVR|nr:hypothetical protein EV356DRAFT_448903 [Viridothelium virens]
MENQDPHQALKTASFPKLEQLANETGTHIQVKRSEKSGNNVVLLFWGQKQQVDAAKAIANKWVSELGGESVKAKAWAKLWSLTPDLKQRLEKKLVDDEQRQAFRQTPETGITFPAIGNVLWPADEYHPVEVLGKSYEALDPIRMDCRCYIVWDDDAFKLMGRDKEMVRTAAIRVRGALFHVVARQMDVRSIYILQLPIEHGALLNIRPWKYYAPDQLRRGVDPDKAQTLVRADMNRSGSLPEADILLDSTLRSRLNAIKIRDTTIELLEGLRYYKGNVKMEFRLGNFMLLRYRHPSADGWQFEDFENMLSQQQFKGAVSQVLGDEELEEMLLKRIMQADHLLEPSSTGTATLEDERPTYSAKINIHNPNGTGNYLYELVFEDSGRMFQCTSQNWSKLDPDCSSPTKLLDVPLIDLQKGSAWALEASATQVVSDESQVPSILLSFAERLAVDPRRARDHANPTRFLWFPEGLPVNYCDQKVSWTFKLIGSMYHVEVARHQHIDLKKADAVIGRGMGPLGMMEKPRWSVTVYHEGWGASLATHANLKVGECTTYPIEATKWFPEDHNTGHASNTHEDQEGCVSLMEKLIKLERVIREKIEANGRSNTAEYFEPEINGHQDSLL